MSEDHVEVSTPMPIGEAVAAEQGVPPTELEATEPTPVVEAEPTAPVAETAEPIVEGEVSLEIQEQAKDVLTQAGLDMGALTNEFTENGELSAESFGKLESAGFPKDLVENYIAGARALATENTAMVQRAAYDNVGGVDNYAAMTEWAGASLDANSIQAFNDAITSADEGRISLAVSGLHAQYSASVGNEGVQVQGSAAPATSGGTVFETKAEMITAISSP